MFITLTSTDPWKLTPDLFGDHNPYVEDQWTNRLIHCFSSLWILTFCPYPDNNGINVHFASFSMMSAGLRSAAMISGVSEKTCNALDKWPWFTYDVGISLPWSCCCSTDGMWGMRVCEWTRRELTLNIRFTGGDYDSGRSGRNGRKRQAKPRPVGEARGGRHREEAGRMAQRPWNEMRCLISLGQVLSYRWSVWCDAEPVKDWTPSAAPGIY